MPEPLSLQQRTRVGSRLNLVESQTQANDAFKETATETLSNVQDLDDADWLSPRGPISPDGLAVWRCPRLFLQNIFLCAPQTEGYPQGGGGVVLCR